MVKLKKIETVVDDMVFRGVWQQHDYFFGWFLQDEANALVSWKGTKTATLNGTVDPTHSSFGFLTDGVDNYIDTNITPSTDLTNASLNDIHIDAYCYDNLDTGDTKALFGINSQKMFAFQSLSLGIVYAINQSTNSSSTTSNIIQDKTRYSIGRINSSNAELFINGVQDKTEADASSSLPIYNLYIGARNNANTSALSHINARQSYFCIGGGYDLAALNNSLNLVQSTFNLD